MSRIKLSEYRAKKILFDALQLKCRSVAVDLSDKSYQRAIDRLPENKLYVSKVDQAVKKRGKNGLVKIKRTKKQIAMDLRVLARKGFRYALVEPYIEHDQSQEHYLAFIRVADGIELRYSTKGGVDIESHPDSISKILLPFDDYQMDERLPEIDGDLIKAFYNVFQQSHMTLLEINPLLITQKGYLPLDAAVEVDSAGRFFSKGAWGMEDIRQDSNPAKSEQAIDELNSKSPASFSLRVLNPNGSFFLLLSGGGASVVVADELAHLKHHKDIANYGEYSGNPNQSETYLYTKEVLNLMLKSKARKKVLIIAGGVANFTDVAKTFAGVIQAMREAKHEISKQKIAIYIRRGGPNQQKGLEAMSDFLSELNINYEVYGPEKSLAAVVARAAKATA